MIAIGLGHVCRNLEQYLCAFLMVLMRQPPSRAAPNMAHVLPIFQDRTGGPGTAVPAAP